MEHAVTMKLFAYHGYTNQAYQSTNGPEDYIFTEKYMIAYYRLIYLKRDTLD